MVVSDVQSADAALIRLCSIRTTIPAVMFYRACDRVLDARLAAALVVKLETEHVELVSAR